METVQTLMMVLVLWMNDGSFSAMATPVAECPNQAVFSGMLESRRKADEFKSWTAYCTNAEFGVERETET